jgi:hypothetical protein
MTTQAAARSFRDAWGLPWCWFDIHAIETKKKLTNKSKIHYQIAIS